MTTMPVEDYADMTGQPVSIETVDEVSLVEAVEDTKSHGGYPHATGLHGGRLVSAWVTRPFSLRPGCRYSHQEWIG
jgi:hypothetical protein